MPIPVDRHEVQEMVAGGAVLLDVLPEEEFAEEHLPGARNLPLAQIDAATAAALPAGLPVVAYCYDSL